MALLSMKLGSTFPQISIQRRNVSVGLRIYVGLGTLQRTVVYPRTFVRFPVSLVSLKSQSKAAKAPINPGSLAETDEECEVPRFNNIPKRARPVSSVA